MAEPDEFLQPLVGEFLIAPRRRPRQEIAEADAGFAAGDEWWQTGFSHGIRRRFAGGNLGRQDQCAGTAAEQAEKFLATEGGTGR